MVFWVVPGIASFLSESGFSGFGDFGDFFRDLLLRRYSCLWGFCLNQDFRDLGILGIFPGICCCAVIPACGGFCLNQDFQDLGI